MEKKIKKNKTKNKNKKKKSKIKNKKERNGNKIKETLKNLKKCIKKSYIFFITLLICTIILTDFKNKKNIFTKIFMSFFSLFISIYLSYHIHVFSHSYNFYKIYNDFLKYLTLSKSKYILYYPIIKLFKFIAIYGDFHDKIHHDSIINRKWHNYIIEFIQNIINSGGIFIILFYFF